jgi:osmoprotectant transport system permease protein
MSWLWSNLGLILGLAGEHARLSAAPIVVGFIVSIPLGWLASRNRAARAIFLTLGGVLFTIPSLALFVSLPAIIGTKILDPLNVVVALSIYAVAVMVRGAADAFASVNPNVINAATSVGFSAWSRFWRVELPLAGPVLLASVRVVSVSTVSLLSVGSLIGVKSLGYLFIDGYQRYFPEEVGIGIIAILILAIIFDQLLVLIGRLLMPWNVRVGTQRKVATSVLVKTQGAEGAKVI